MQPDSAWVGFMSTCRASIKFWVLPSLAKNSATHTTWVVFLFGIFASRFHRSQGLIQVHGLLRRLVFMHDRAHRLDHRLGRIALEDVAPHVDSGSALVYGVPGHIQRIEFR